MKARYENNLDYGKKLAKYLMIAVVVLGLLTVFFAPQGSLLQTLMIIATVSCMIGIVVVVYKYCRCPYCGKHIFMGVLRIKVCPACNRNLETGKKAKKNER